MSGMCPAWKWILLLAVVASPWLVGLSFPFLYDDVGMLAENSFLEDPANLGKVLTGQTLTDPRVVNGRRPAVLTTYFLDRALYGLEPPGWRVTNLLLHLGCVALLMLLLWRLTGRGFFTAAAGVLFGLHPVLLEVVHAPGFRADALCLFFVLASLHGFLGAGPRTAIQRTGGVACLMLALLSKETAVAAPILLSVLMFLFPVAFPAERRMKATRLAVCVGIAAGFFALWALLPADLQAAGGSWNGESLRFPETVFSMPALWMHTLRLLLVPWPLNVAPGFDPVTSAVSIRFALGLGWLVACGWGAWRARQVGPEVSLGLAWMAIFFLPVSNLWPLLHPVADRYLYPVAPGFAVLAAWLLSHQSRPGRLAGLSSLAAIYAVLVLLRLGQWESAHALWTAAYFQNSKSATAATWLGLLREEAGDADGAREFYKAAIESNPQADSAWMNWGILEGKLGNWNESERRLRRAVELRPEEAKGWHNLAVCLERQNRMEEAATAAAHATALQTTYGNVKP
jgi:protein O-mannosyl-transferase